MSNYPITDWIGEIVMEAGYSTAVTNMLSGKSLRVARHAEPVWRISGAHNLTQANCATLEAFFREMKGQLTTFTWTDPVSRTWGSDSDTSFYVGTGDASTTVFDIPGKTISSYTIYVNGVAKTEGASNDYTISADGGTDGRAQVTFTAAPSSGHRIGVIFTGYLALETRFANDAMPWRAKATNRDLIEVELIQDD